MIRAYRAVERSDVVLALVDGTEEPAAQDVKIAGYAHDRGKASVLVVNKWDAVERDEDTAKEYKESSGP